MSDTPDSQSPSPDELADATDLDVRTVSVIWSGCGDDECIEIAYSGCSTWEAESLARAAVRHFRRINDDMGDLDDEDDADED